MTYSYQPTWMIGATECCAAVEMDWQTRIARGQAQNSDLDVDRVQRRLGGRPCASKTNPNTVSDMLHILGVRDVGRLPAAEGVRFRGARLRQLWKK